MLTLSLFLCFSLFIYYFLSLLKPLSSTQSKIILYIKNKFEKQQWFLNSKIFLKTYIIEGPSLVYEDFCYRFIYLKPFLDKIGILLSYNFTDRPQIPYLLGIVIPRIIPCIILCYETLYLRHLNYFYKTLFLLLLPLLFNILIYMIQHHATKSIDFYLEYFDFNMTDTKLTIIYKQFTNPEILKKQDSMAQRAGNNYEFYQEIYNVTYQINDYKNKKQRYLSTIIYFLMSISLLCQLLIIINFI